MTPLTLQELDELEKNMQISADMLSKFIHMARQSLETDERWDKVCEEIRDKTWNAAFLAGFERAIEVFYEACPCSCKVDFGPHAINCPYNVIAIALEKTLLEIENAGL